MSLSPQTLRLVRARVLGALRSDAVRDVRQPAVSKLPRVVSQGDGASLEHQRSRRLPHPALLQPLPPGAVLHVRV